MSTLRLLVLAFAGLATAFVAASPDTQADLKAAYQAAREVVYTAPAEVQIYDALATLSTTPDSNAELLRLMDAAQSPEMDAALKPALGALEALRYARMGEMTEYKRCVAALQKQSRDPQLLETVNVSDLLVTCTTCRGRLTCRTCKGTLKCPTCNGKGTTTRKSSSSSGSFLAASSSTKVTCSTCRGEKHCPACRGEPKTCATCTNTGKHPDEKAVSERIRSLAASLCESLRPSVAQELHTREQTLLLAEELKRAEAMPEVDDALAFFASLPEARLQALQWSQAELCRTLLQSIKEATSAEALERERQRTSLRTAIREAQQADDLHKGLELLESAMQRHADCDILPEAQAAFDTLLAAYAKQQRLRFEQLVERKALIGGLQSPEERIRQLEATLTDWDALAPRPPSKKFRTADTEDATALKADFEQLLTEAKAQLTESPDDKKDWWIWGGVAFAGLLLLSGLAALLQKIRERQAELARRERERAIRESIRRTFSHQHKH